MDFKTGVLGLLTFEFLQVSGRVLLGTGDCPKDGKKKNYRPEPESILNRDGHAVGRIASNSKAPQDLRQGIGDGCADANEKTLHDKTDRPLVVGQFVGDEC